MPGAVSPPSSALVAAAEYHGVIAELRRAYGLYTDDGRTRELRATALAARGIALRATCAAVDVSTWLRDAGIAHAVVKGPALARFYPESDRTFVDLDVLVHAEHMSAAIAALVGHGCTLVDGMSWPRADGVGEISVALQSGVTLDLHADLIHRPDVRRCFWFPARKLLGRTSQMEILGRQVPVLDREDTLIHVALHAVISGGDRLIWLADLDRLVASGEVRWEIVVERAQEAGLALVVGVMLCRASITLGTEVPDEALATLLRGGRVWSQLLIGFDRMRPVSRSYGRLFRGQILVRATRQGTLSSLVALTRLVVSGVIRPLLTEADHPWRRALARHDVHRR